MARIVGTDENDKLVGTDLLDTIEGEGGDDIIIGKDGNDSLFDGAGVDSLYGGDGDDTLHRYGNAKFAGLDYFDGGAGVDTLKFSSRDLVIFDLVDQTRNDRLARNLIVTNIENISGGRYHDDIRGDDNANEIRGGGSFDLLMGRGGDDTLYGQYGKDRIDGGTGSDYMDGGLGDDTFIVDTIGDTVVEADDEGNDTVKSSVGYVLGDNVENLTLTGKATIGRGNDLDNVITGNAERNVLQGGAGNDVLDGGANNDTIIGGLGADILTGGSGRDVFVFRQRLDSPRDPHDARDTIVDFSQKSGDKIDLSAVDAKSNIPGQQEFYFSGTEEFKGVSGQLRYSKQASDTFIYADLNGDKAADFSIHLKYSLTLTEADFILV